MIPKFLTVFCSSLLVVFLLSGCANDQYAIEKEYWWAKKQAEKVFKNPEGSPPFELEQAIKKLNKFSQKYQKSNLAIDAEFNISRLYLVKKEYDKSRAQLKLMLGKHKELKAICSDALFFIGKAYEAEDKWGMALEQYKKVIQLYPETLRGFDLPVYIAGYYRAKHQPDKMIAAFGEAITYYKSLAAKYPNSQMSIAAYNQVISCYAALKDWQNAINSLDVIAANYKGKVPLDRILFQKALIYSSGLKDNLKAKETLKELIRDYPESKLIKNATALLEKMEKK